MSLYYTQPRFRVNSPDVERAVGQHGLVPNMRLRIALDYYRFESFATSCERDRRCGPTAHEDVIYEAASMADLEYNGVSIDDIACGHDIDHAGFDAVISPLFDAAFRRLFQQVVDSPKDQDGIVADRGCGWMDQIPCDGDDLLREGRPRRHRTDQRLVGELYRAQGFALVVRRKTELTDNDLAGQNGSVREP